MCEFCIAKNAPQKINKRYRVLQWLEHPTNGRPSVRDRVLAWGVILQCGTCGWIRQNASREN